MCRETATASQLCVYPNLWLIPSDLVIIKKMIPGYNNVLYRPERRCYNYSKPAAVPAEQCQPVEPSKKVHQQGGDHLGSLNEETWNKHSKKVAKHNNVSNERSAKPVEKDPVLVSDGHTSELMKLGVLGDGVGVLVYKYAL